VAPDKLVYKRHRNLTEEDLRKQIVHAPEISLDHNLARTESIEMVLANRQAAKTGQHDVTPALLMQRADLHGLPFRMGDACKISPAAADHLQGGSLALRANLFDAANATASRLSTTLAGDTRPDPAKFQSTLASGERKEQWQRPESVPALMQLLMAENEAIRLVLIEQLAKIPGDKASLALANRAVFDLNPEVRLAALNALNTRPRAEFRQAILEGLRYPWAVINDHAAEALVALKMNDTVPAVVAMLDEPNPNAPYEKPGVGTVVREVVRVNHLHNCLMCHAPSFDSENDKVRGFVPPTTQPLPPAFTREYYTPRQEGTFVRADITYLQQDFSVPMPVANHGVWPEVQRNDFMVRERHAAMSDFSVGPKLKPGEARPPTDHERAIFFALRELTGKDPGPTAEDWKRVFIRPQDVTSVQKGLTSVGGIAADAAGVIYYSDRSKKTIVRQGDTTPITLPSTGRFEGLALDSARNRLLACEPATSRILAIDLKTNAETVLLDGVKQGLAPRHLVVDKRGGVYFSSREPEAYLGWSDPSYRAPMHYLSAQGTLTRLPCDSTRPRGLGLSVDQNTLYVAAGESNKVFAYTLESVGVLSKGRVLATLSAVKDLPAGSNGLTVDQAGNIYVARSGLMTIEVLNAEGARLGRISTQEIPLFCAVGGEGQKTLFVTTKTEVLSVKLVTEQNTASVSR
jgi:gluconolactonase